MRGPQKSRRHGPNAPHCNIPAVVKLSDHGSGLVLCLNNTTAHSNAKQFNALKIFPATVLAWASHI
jgi:hypothetical protein